MPRTRVEHTPIRNYLWATHVPHVSNSSLEPEKEACFPASGHLEVHLAPSPLHPVSPRPMAAGVFTPTRRTHPAWSQTVTSASNSLGTFW